MTEFLYVVLFLEPNGNIHHIIWYETLPNIASLKSAFDELLHDEEFGVNNSEFIDSLNIAIINREDFLAISPECSKLYPTFLNNE